MIEPIELDRLWWSIGTDGSGQCGETEASMQVECRSDGVVAGATRVTLDGLLDQHGAEALWRSARGHLSESAPLLIVDLSGVALMTSAGVGVLVRLLHRVESLGGRMALCGGGRRVREVIEVVRLGDILNLCDSVDEARSRVRAGG